MDAAREAASECGILHRSVRRQSRDGETSVTHPRTHTIGVANSHTLPPLSIGRLSTSGLTQNGGPPFSIRYGSSMTDSEQKALTLLHDIAKGGAQST